MKRAAILVTILAALFVTAAAAATPGEVPVGSVLRDIPMKGLIGPGRKLSAYFGKPLIINVWASWCGPCREEMGSLELLSQRDGGTQFNVIGISTDDYEVKALAFLRRSNTTFSNFLDDRLALESMLGADHLPLTLLVDAKGRVLARHYGSKQWDSPQAARLIESAFQIKIRN